MKDRRFGVRGSSALVALIGLIALTCGVITAPPLSGAAGADPADTVDLSITTDGSSASASVNDLFHHYYTVTNSGPDAAAHVVVTFATFGSNLVWSGLDGATVPGGTCDTPLDTCAIESIAAGQSVTIDAPFLVVQEGSFTTQAVVSCDCTDTDPDNDSAEITTTLNPAYVPTSALSISQTGPAVAAQGSVASYEIEVTNGGPDPADNVSAADYFPTYGGTLLSATSPDGSCTVPSYDGGVLCSFGTLPAGTTVHATVKLTVAWVSSLPGVLYNQVLLGCSCVDSTPDDNGFFEVDTLIPSLGSAPSATLDLSSTGGNVPATTTATITASDAEDDPLTYEVDWGDGTTTDSGSLPATDPSHVYTVPGSYTVTLTVSDGTDSVTATQPFTAEATAPVVTSTVNPVGLGVPTMLTATVPDPVTPAAQLTGTMVFSDNGTPVGAPVAVMNGKATKPFHTSISGDHTIVAVYTRTGGYPPVASDAFEQYVDTADTVTVLSSSVPSSLAGQAVVLSASVKTSPVVAGTVSSGSVVFSIDGAPIGSPVAVKSGLARISLPASVAVGSHTVSADFGASTSFNPSSAAPITQMVTTTATNVALKSNVTPAVTGQTITYTATVRAAAPGGGMPTGTVTFSANGDPVADVALDATGRAVLKLAPLHTGIESMRADYHGDTRDDASASAVLDVPVDRALTDVVVKPSGASVVTGQSITYVATVRVELPGKGTPTGTISIHDGLTELASGLVLDASGSAQVTVSAQGIGAHLITASYTGDADTQLNNSPVRTVTVKQAATRSTIASSGTPTVVGQSVTFTVSVLVLAPGSGTPAGSVSFYDGSILLGTVALGSGSASFPTSSLARGVHLIRAIYSGSPELKPSTSTAARQVVR